MSEATTTGGKTCHVDMYPYKDQDGKHRTRADCGCGWQVDLAGRDPKIQATVKSLAIEHDAFFGLTDVWNV
jgi:hypothetical protein